MRRCTSIVLAILLVLRVLLGDAMAMGVAPQPAPHMAADVAHPASHGAHDGHDCCSPAGGEHAQHQADCTACGACHSAPGIPAWMPAPPAAPGGAPLPQRDARFASAPAAQAIKPPIA